MTRPLRVAFIHPDLGIGGAERLVVDAALGLQTLGHSVDIYTSHHDTSHCFDETIDGSLNVRYIRPPLPRSIAGKFHILFAHARQLHLTGYLLQPWVPTYDVYFVDQLSTCIPFLRLIGKSRVVFYCHFPDKLLSNGAFVEDSSARRKQSVLKRIYRLPMDFLEEFTTRQADVLLANSNFTARVFKAHFPSIKQVPKIVYPGINIAAYEAPVDASDPDIIAISSHRPTLISLNRFEKKKNAALAVQSFAKVKAELSNRSNLQHMRLVLAGGYDPRLQDNSETLSHLIDIVNDHAMTYHIMTPSSSNPISLPPQLETSPATVDVVFLLNFTTAQRTALLTSPSTQVMMYTPANEHFGIVPVEGMICGVSILACDSGGPVESIVDQPADERTGWLRAPDPEIWAAVLREILTMTDTERAALGERSKKRARTLFGMDAMAAGLEVALKDAVAMGDVGVTDGWRVFLVILVGFLVAYLLGPWLLPVKSS